MRMTHRLWMGASAVVLVAVVVLAALRIWQQSRTEAVLMALLDPACDLQRGPCQAGLPGGGRISLSIAPRPIEGLKPLHLEVEAQGLMARAVEVDFRGLGMNMGYNRPQLKQQAEGRFSGSAVLSACILDRMTWEATVLVSTDVGVLAAPFRFETSRN